MFHFCTYNLALCLVAIGLTAGCTKEFALDSENLINWGTGGPGGDTNDLVAGLSRINGCYKAKSVASHFQIFEYKLCDDGLCVKNIIFENASGCADYTKATHERVFKARYELLGPSLHAPGHTDLNITMFDSLEKEMTPNGWVEVSDSGFLPITIYTVFRYEAGNLYLGESSANYDGLTSDMRYRVSALASYESSHEKVE